MAGINQLFAVDSPDGRPISSQHAGGFLRDPRQKLGGVFKRRRSLRTLQKRHEPAGFVRGILVQARVLQRQGRLVGKGLGEPDLIARGFVVDQRTDAVLRDVPPLLAEVIAGASVEERTDQGLIKEKVRVELQRFLRKRSGRRPLVLPVIMEI